MSKALFKYACAYDRIMCSVSYNSTTGTVVFQFLNLKKQYNTLI